MSYLNEGGPEKMVQSVAETISNLVPKEKLKVTRSTTSGLVNFQENSDESNIVPSLKIQACYFHSFSYFYLYI